MLQDRRQTDHQSGAIAERIPLADAYHRHAPNIAAYLRHTGALTDIAGLLTDVFVLAQSALDEQRATPIDLDLPWFLRAARNRRESYATHGRRAAVRASTRPITDPLTLPLQARPLAEREVLFLRCGLGLDTAATARTTGQPSGEIQRTLLSALIALTGITGLSGDPTGHALIDGQISAFLAGKPNALHEPVADLVWNLRRSFAPNFADQAASVRGWSMLITRLRAGEASALPG